MRLIDMTHLSWDTNPTKTVGTGGTFYKAIDTIDGVQHYYKMSSFDKFTMSFTGYESVFEVIVSRLCELFKVHSLRYNLIHAKICINGRTLTGYITDSAEFKQRGESKIALENFYQLEAPPDIDPYEFCKQMKWTDRLDEMFFIDYLICNRDRHGANLEVLQHGVEYRLAPLFDNGLSFTAPFGTALEAIVGYDVMSDIPCNNYLGSRYLTKNLELISNDFVVPTLPTDWKDAVSAEIKEAMPDIVWSKVFEMIDRRYVYVCDKLSNKRC